MAVSALQARAQAVATQTLNPTLILTGPWVQAMAAYRTAARLFPGLHQPLLGMAMEYQRMNNLALAIQLAQQAYKVGLFFPAPMTDTSGVILT